MTRSTRPSRPKLTSQRLITGDPQRDEHLRSPDFFDVANHPTMTFESRSISGSREHFKVTGDLTIRGQTREVTLDVTFNGIGTNPLGQPVAGFTAETQINRKDFGLNWNMALEAGGVLVGDTPRSRSSWRPSSRSRRLPRTEGSHRWKSELIASPPGSTTPAWQPAPSTVCASCSSASSRRTRSAWTCSESANTTNASSSTPRRR